MVDPDLIVAVTKAVQMQLENQTSSWKKAIQTMQECLVTIDSKVEELRTQVQGGSGSVAVNQASSSQVIENFKGTEVNPEVFPAIQAMKMEVPRFDGLDPEGWILRIEEFFDFVNTPKELRLKIVSFHMEGKAAAWFQWMKANQLITNWKGFLSNVKHRFGNSMFEDHQGALSELTQTSTVAEFQSEFEELMNKVTRIAEPLLVSFFITGLKSEFRRELMFSRPSTLMEAFALARAYEAGIDDDRLMTRLKPISTIQAQMHSSVVSSSTQNSTPSSSQPFHTLVHTPKLESSPYTPIYYNPATSNSQSTTITNQNLPIRRLSPSELRERRDKGLCYNCDQKYNLGHKCRSKFLLLLGDEEDGMDFEVNIEQPSEAIRADISSLNVFVRHMNPRSLRMLGNIENSELQVLIDGGSSHNFIKPTMVEKDAIIVLKGDDVKMLSNVQAIVDNKESQDIFELCFQALIRDGSKLPKIEVVSKVLEQILCACELEKSDAWFNCLLWEELCFNTSNHNGFHLMYDAL